MSATPILSPGTQNVPLDSPFLSSSATPSLLGRASNWISEHKVIVCTVGAVAIVFTGAGIVYYLSETGKPGDDTRSAEEKRKSKKDRRKAKKQAEEAKKAGVSGICFNRNHLDMLSY